MLRATRVKILSVSVMAAVLLGAFLGLRHYHTALCNGYRLVTMNGYEVVVAKPDNEVITSGTVISFAVKPPYVTGYTSSEHMSPDTEPVDGYFLIDTRNGSVADGLSRAEWERRLTQLHWANPKLRKPW